MSNDIVRVLEGIILDEKCQDDLDGTGKDCEGTIVITEDPYIEELYGESVVVMLCQRHLQQHCDDI